MRENVSLVKLRQLMTASLGLRLGKVVVGHFKHFRAEAGSP